MDDDRSRRPVDEETACEHGGHGERPRRTASSDASLEQAARIFRAFAEPSRLRLLEQLEEGELCVTEIAATAGVGISTVSQQLRVLRTEGLLRRRREGKHIFYSLADQHVIDIMRSVLDHVAEEDAPDMRFGNRQTKD